MIAKYVKLAAWCNGLKAENKQAPGAEQGL